MKLLEAHSVRRIAVAMALVTLGLAVLAAQRTMSNGRKEAVARQDMAAAQVASRLRGLLDSTMEILPELQLGQIVTNHESMQAYLEAKLELHQSGGWTAIQVVDNVSGLVMGLAGSLDHVHMGEGVTECIRCTDAHQLVLRNVRDEYAIEVALDLESLREQVFAPVGGEAFEGSARIEGGLGTLITLGHGQGNSPIESGYEIYQDPPLRVVVVSSESSITAGLRVAVWTQLAATLGFSLLMMVAYRALQLSWRREARARDLEQETKLEAQRRTAHMDRLATMGTLAASVAHELASPLTYVTANVELAVAQWAAKDTEGLDELLMDSSLGCAKMRTILSDMRTFAHPGTQVVEVVYLADVIASAGRLANARLRHVAKLDLAMDEVPGIRGNASRLGQVFLNLFVNAADALAQVPGSGEMHQISVRSRVDSDTETLHLSVTDTGPGVPEALREKIFESFFTTKEPGKGTGLGLAICREIIREHGGEMTLAPGEEGQGARFEISLSMSRAPISQSKDVSELGSGSP